MGGTLPGYRRTRTEQNTMNTKHTPGPWEAVDKRPWNEGFSIFSGNEYVAFVGDSDARTPAGANAALIAAAPDMLAALRDIDLRTAQAIIANDIGNPSKEKQIRFLLGEIERIKGVARATIAKAEGGQA